MSTGLVWAATIGVHAQESWDAIYLGGAKIGFIHTFVEKVQDRGRDFLRVRIEIEQNLKRGKDVTSTRLMYGTIETLSGQVLKLDTLTKAGDGNRELRAHGNVIRGKMNLILEGAGQQQQLQIPWSPEVRGPYAAEQSMARKPLVENEQRSLKMFMPDLNKICDVQLQSRGLERVVLGDKSYRSLLRVEQTHMVDGKRRPEFDATLWVDDHGQVLKSEQDLFGGIVIYRTTEEGAKSASGPIQFDLIKNTVIKVASKIPTAERTRYVKYRLTLKEGDLSEVIPNDPRQALQPNPNKNSGLLEVRSVGLLDGEPGPADVDPQFVKPNALVTSQDSQVRSLAQRATRGVVDPWQKVERINHYVFEIIRDKNFGVAFAAASEVARNLSGDCTEHSVLAAAMYRAVGIPSRVAVGLIYVEEQAGFGYHMWNEVYINQRWIALDPSFDQATVDAVHIKLSDSSLEGVSPFETFLPVLRVSGKMEIEPIELR
jgi:hypothetical protein